MNRNVAVLVVVFALTIGSGGALKCYVCNSIMNSSCSDDILNSKLKPVECTSHSMTEPNINDFSSLPIKEFSTILDTDIPQQGHVASPACGKINIKVGELKFTLRHCQIAKTESLDPCSIIQKKFKSIVDSQKLEVTSTLDCSICEKDACNGKMAMVPKAFYMIFPVVTALALGNGNYMA